MTAISEDTPRGGPEELQWQIDELRKQIERQVAELQRERRAHGETKKDLAKALDRFLNLTSRLTVGVLRKAGYTVKIEEAEFCEACGEEY